MRLARSIVFLAAAVVIVLGAFGALAAEKSFGPFKVNSARSDVILLNGEIGENSALDFRRALNAAPEAKLMVLDSPGGSVSMALLIADDIFQRNIATLIPADARCFSACAYLFFAGRERVADGRLGVHQISADLPDLETAQLAISDIIDVLNRFEAPIEVLTVMFRTPSDRMHVFSPQEIADYGIERRRDAEPAAAPGAGAQASPETAPSPEAEEFDALSSAPSMAAPRAGLSVIERYARRPDRIAVYTGLDFFGADLSSVRSADLAGCAARCLEAGEPCKIFTFNADEAVSGPNCFLKGEGATADGNAVALSGVLLRPADPDPAPIIVGAIDPRLGLMRDVDLPGGDLSIRPLASATSAQQCRLACVRRQDCEAFTFVRALRACWLKGEPFGLQSAAGMVSGRKSRTAFSPVRIIPLE